MGRSKLNPNQVNEDTLQDKDNDTTIKVETSDDEDKIRFTTDGVERLIIDETGQVGIGTSAPDQILTLNDTTPTISFKEANSDRAEIGINDSDNLVITNQSSNRHIVFKANDAGTIREGLRLDGAVPEVVVNQTSDSLVNFRVESDNNTHMLYVDGTNDRVGINESNPQADLHVNGTMYVSSSANQEAIRIAKANADTREIVFENEGTDIASIFVNAAESLRLKCEKLNGSIVFQVNNGGSVENLMFLDGANLRAGINTATPTAALDVVGGATFSQPISFEDVLMTELSIPGVDVQTDTNAYRFNCPYNLTVGSLALNLDQHTTSGDVTVTVTNTTTSNTMITFSLTGTSLGGATTTVSNASAAQGDVITFAITATPADAQGLRAILGFRRDL